MTFLEVSSLSYGAQLQRAENRLIEGDNLDVLAALPEASIDLIYTDPPYGTGQRFRYDDQRKRLAWMAFMAPRLHRMRHLLKSSGVVAISIGKEELFSLAAFLEDLFGEDNQLGIINWQKKYAPSNDSRHLADATDYILVYGREQVGTLYALASLEESEASLWGRNDPCFERSRLLQGTIPLLPFPSTWYQKPFELGCQSWGYKQSGHNQDAKKLLNAIMGTHGFATPKPLKLIEKIIQLWCPPDGVVLDPFAGSGTTAHAVLDLNACIGSKRTFILVEQGNTMTADAFARTLTAERLRRVLTGEWAAGKRPPLPGSFVFQCLAESDCVSREAA